MTRDIQFLTKDYTLTNINLEWLYRVKVPVGSKALGTHTRKDMCGFLIPIQGKAKYEVNGHEYLLNNGKILHSGPGMSLNKMVLGNEEWEYYLLYYKIIGGNWSDTSLSQFDYCLETSTEKRRDILLMCDCISTSLKEGGLLQELKNKMFMLQFIHLILEASYESQLGSKKEKAEYIINYIHQHLHEELTIEDLADKVKMNSKQLYYTFTKYMGLSPKRYVMERRMKRAVDLMLETSFSISEIARLVGYRDPLYFSRIFKKHMGMSPTDYKVHLGKIHVN